MKVATAFSSVLLTAAWTAFGGGGVDVLCIYYPEWHAYPEGDAIFGRGRTEWDFVDSAKPRFKGHEQPIELLDGHPNDADPKDVAKEIDYASDAGIDVFVYDWYWSNGRPIQHEALEEGFLKSPNRGRMKFALMWANHNRSDVFRTAPGRCNDRFFWKLDYSRAEFLAAIDHCIAHYFNRPEYYRRDGKLFFSVYAVSPLIRGVGGAAALKAVFAEAQERVRKAGLPPIHFSAMVHATEIMGDVRAAGFDSASAYNVTPYDFDDADASRTNGETRQIFDYADYAAAQKSFNAQFARLPEYVPYIPVVCRGWDCTPRCRQDEPFPFRTLAYPYLGVITGATPSVFGEMVAAARRQAANDPKKPGAILVNAWNEYTEGSYLMPDRRHGDGFLRALRAARDGKVALEPLRVVLSFDDACKDQLLIAVPMLEERGWRGVFNIVTDWVGKGETRLTWDDVRELVRRGHEVATHTRSHAQLVRLLEAGNTNAVHRELAESRDRIARETGVVPRYLCAPYIQQNGETDRICREERLEQMNVRRCNFTAANADQARAVALDALARGWKSVDFLHHGISMKDHGGYGAFPDRAAFARHLDEIAALEREGLVVVTNYAACARGRD